MKTTLSFLKELQKNNNRDWFQENKSTYKESQEELKVFSQHLTGLMKKHDNVDEQGVKLFRIYRDVRFSKNKLPYKTNRGMHIKRNTEKLRGGYYLHIEPGNSFLGGGFFRPSSEDLLHIRKQIQPEPEVLRQIINDKNFKKYFGELGGDRVKTAPKGFSKDDPAIDLLRYKQFLLMHKFTDKDVLNKEFVKKVDHGFQLMRPFFDYMSEILTTDLNGVPLFDE